MTAPHTRALAPLPSPPAQVESRYLYRIIDTVSSTLDLDRVLAAIVDLVTEATDCHACFLYVVDPEDGALLLRAVSDPYRALVGRLRLEAGEGLAGWAATHREAVFISEDALSDPRIKVVPEAEEEKYQSFVGVPLMAKSGDVIGVIALHAVAPKEFTQEHSDFLENAASLVASAIENARLYEATRRRLALVEGMAEIARAVSAASSREALLPAVVRRAQRLLDAEACQMHVVKRDRRRLVPGATWPEGALPDRVLQVEDLGVELALASRQAAEAASSRRLAAALWGPELEATALVLPLVAAGELMGFLALCDRSPRRLGREEREIAASIADQTAVALKKLELIDRLTERNAIKDFLEDLAHGAAGAAELEARGRALGLNLAEPHLVLQAVPRSGEVRTHWDEVAASLEAQAVRAFPGSLFDRRDAAVRGLVRLGGTAPAAAVSRLGTLHAALNERHPLAIGLSSPCAGAASFAAAFEEAEHAVVAASVVRPDPSVVSFDDLGAYKYLLRVSQDGRARDPRGEALRKLAEYDERHRSQLLLTLEEFLQRRGNIAAAAQNLYVHPNTLRQRLRRIQELTGLDVANEDWLVIEIELKLLRLETALGRGGSA